MPRSYRGLFAAIAGLALAGPSYGQTSQPEKADASANSRAQLERIAAALEKVPEAPAPDRGCSEGQDDRQSDLCAQWKAADAAADAARWTFWTLIAGLAGMVIGAGTLLAAWLAAHWAKKAAEHTDTANQISTNAEQRQLRAYLTTASVDFSGVKAPRGSPEFNLRLVNCGQTPVLALRGHITAYAAIWDHKPRFVTKAVLKKMKPQNVGMNREVGAIDRPFALSESERDAYRRKQLSIFIVASHTYEDVYGNQYRLDQVFRSRGPDDGGIVDPLMDRETKTRTANSDTRHHPED